LNEGTLVISTTGAKGVAIQGGAQVVNHSITTFSTANITIALGGAFTSTGAPVPGPPLLNFAVGLQGRNTLSGGGRFEVGGVAPSASYSISTIGQSNTTFTDLNVTVGRYSSVFVGDQSTIAFQSDTAADVTLGGQWNTSYGSTVSFSSSAVLGALTVDLLNNASLAGSGRYRVTGRVVLQAKDPDTENFPFPKATISNLTLSTTGPKLVTSGQLTISNSFVWSGGQIARDGNPGFLVIDNSAYLLIANTSPSSLILDGPQITNYGTVIWSSGSIRELDPATIVNDGIKGHGSFNISSSGSLVFGPLPFALPRPGTFFVQNGAVVRKLLGAPTRMDLNLALLTHGKVFILPFTSLRFFNTPDVASLNNGGAATVSGNLTVQGAAQQVAGSTVINASSSLAIGGSLQESGGTVSLLSGTLTTTNTYTLTQTGTLTGTGSITSPVVQNAAFVMPGSTSYFGSLSITGDYFQSSAGQLTLGLANPASGNSSDSLSVTGNALLAGTLNLNFPSGFTPTSAGQTYTVLTSTSQARGTFSAVNISVTGSSTSGYTVVPIYPTSAVGGVWPVQVEVISTPLAAPTITSTSTSTSTTNGGQTVTITGTNFQSGANPAVSEVLFGSVPATSFTVNSATQITAVAPAQASGSATISVTTAGGAATSSFSYTSGTVASVTSLGTTSDYLFGGNTITINGSHFTGATGVSFGGVASPYFYVVSDSQITAIDPAQTSAGTVDVQVTNYTGTSSTGSGDQFTYSVQPAPTVSSLSSSSGSGAGGASITITGTNFANVSQVYFGGIFAASFTVNSSTSITAVTPASAAGTFDVSVSTAGGVSAAVSTDQYTFSAPSAPSITSLTTTSGSTAGNTQVIINGSNFSGATQVLFGTVPATEFILNSATMITAFSPSQVAGTVDVTVTTPGGGTSAVSSSDHFTYNAASAPTVTALGTSSGTSGGGAIITVTGTGFTGATAVNFGTVAASSFQVLSDTTLVATAPAQPAATVDVTVTTPSGTSATSSADHYTYSAASAPSVSAVTPSSGSTTGGGVVVMTGSGFTGASAVNFGTAAADFLVNADNSITAWAPSGTAGTVDITVTTPSGTSSTSSADHYTYTAAFAPTVTSLGTTSGSAAGGTQVVISGTGFTGASQVNFGSLAVNDFTVNSDSQITVFAPPQSVSTLDVTVVTPAGVSALSSSDRYSYTSVSAPAVSSLGTSSGSTAGGTSVTITGTNFTAATGVLFGTVAASSFTVNSDTSITATAPPQTAGTVDVTVAAPGGTSVVSSSDHFTYTAASAPSVTSLATTSGSSNGGTLVTITGSNFTGATGVWFGAIAASSFTVNSDTSITAYAPPQAAGTVDVVVTTYAGTSSTSSSDHFAYSTGGLPGVGAVSANSGSTPGGNIVVITGGYFTGATAVKFGTVAATSFVVNSDTSITVVAPPSAAGTVDITVTTPTGTGPTSSADHYTYTNVTASAPAVTAVSPNTGSIAGGQVVTITGTNFSGATAVFFVSTPATSFTINSDTSITAIAPAHAVGTTDIAVTTNNGTSAFTSADHFTYLSTAAPAISSLSPTSGSTAGGTSVTVNGSNFTSASAVYFGGIAATSFTVNSSSKITATAPAEAAGTVDVKVVTPSGTSGIVSADHFTFNAASAPTVTSLGTTSGSTAGGTSVTITGTNFTGATNVYFNGVPASSFTVSSSTSITATSPAQAAGVIDVTVSTYAGTSALSSGDRFTYTAASAPAITSLGTSTGTTAGGTSVTITGTNFTGATAVYFGSVAAASFIVNSSTSITATSPPQATGTVDITVTTYTGTSAVSSSDHFTYTAASAPTVTSLGTSSGSTGGGTSVTITGTNFTGATAVSFGSVAASFTVNSSTSITAIAPSQAAGTVDVTVTTYAGTSSTSSADHFTYNAASAPSVTAITPTSGSVVGGTSVTITGSGFSGASAVNFGTTAALAFSVISDNAIVAIAPDGSAGTVDITVTTPSGTSSTSSADQFTWTAVSTPTITSLGTTSGSTAGGTSVIITGTNFTNASGVSFGGVAASFWVVSDTQIVATAPASIAGVVDITVSVPDATSALSSSDQFTYTAASAPAVTSLGTSSGSTAGGTSVTITGSSFTGTTGVFFGSVAATSFTVNSSTSITAISPSQAVGTVDVTVLTPTGTSAVGSGDQFTYSAASAPSVTSLSLTSGSTAGGIIVTINGSGFTGTTQVSFGTVAASFSVLSDTVITATVPAQAAGTIDVTVTTPSGTSSTSSADHFTYTAASAPAVTAITPSSGSTTGGTLVTVLGSGFTAATTVSFGSVAADYFLVLSDNALLVAAPAGTAGTVDITVTTPSGTSSTSSADHFTYSAASTPSVTSLNVTSGSTGGGTAIIITGSGFTGATSVTFGGVLAATVIVNSDTQITVLTPSQVAGVVDVVVTTAAGSSATSSADQYTYTAASAPAVTSVTPSSGPTGGGTVVIINGTDFWGALQVMFGSIAATTFWINPDGSITAIAPAGTGTVDITVTTPSGTSATSSSDQFTY
jgi:hypothetical protein